MYLPEGGRIIVEPVSRIRGSYDLKALVSKSRTL